MNYNMSDQGGDGNGVRRPSGKIQLQPAVTVAARSAATPGAFKHKEPVLETDQLIGKIVDERYRIDSHLSDGGMGEIYIATCLPSNRQVVLKTVSKDNPLFRARFNREMRAMESFNHPNIVCLLDRGVLPDSRSYVIMEHVNGGDLHSQVLEMRDARKKGDMNKSFMPWERVLKIMLQVCDGLETIHGLGIIHRDLKPANILIAVDENGTQTAKIIDFGIVRLPSAPDDPELTHLGGKIQEIGTPAYMSPEQVEDASKCDNRSDLYSLGAMMYVLLTGIPVFPGKNSEEVHRKHQTARPISLRTRRQEAEIPEAFEAIVLKALEKDPNKRHQNVDELRRELVALRDSDNTELIFRLESMTLMDPTTIRITTNDLITDPFRGHREQDEWIDETPIPLQNRKLRTRGTSWAGLGLFGAVAMAGAGLLLYQNQNLRSDPPDANVVSPFVQDADAVMIVPQAEPLRRTGYAVTLRTTLPLDVYSLGRNGRTITRIGDTTTPFLYQSPDSRPHSLVLMRRGFSISGRPSFRMDLTPLSPSEILTRVDAAGRGGSARRYTRREPLIDRAPLVQTPSVAQVPTSSTVNPDGGPSTNTLAQSDARSAAPHPAIPQESPDPDYQVEEIDPATMPRP